MYKYFLITRDTSMFSMEGLRFDIIDTKKLCELKIIEREKEGYELVTVIRGRELKVKTKEVVIEYEIEDTIHLPDLRNEVEKDLGISINRHD